MPNCSIPYISINPAYICTYNRPEYNRSRTLKERNNERNLANNNNNGKVSKKAKKSMEKAINWMLYEAKEKLLYPNSNKIRFKFKIAFVTLTLSSSQSHTDNYIKKNLLQPFLDKARKKWNVTNYVWRAERQKNGRIHFHIILDQYIHWNELRNEWNKIQAKNGYMNEFREKFGHKNPNSTDIHSVYKIKNIARYLAKYITKEEKNKKVEGRLWGLSYSLSCLKNASEMIDSKISAELEKIWSKFKSKVVKRDYVEICYVGIKEWFELDLKLLKRVMDEYLSACRQVKPACLHVT